VNLSISDIRSRYDSNNQYQTLFNVFDIVVSVHLHPYI